MHLYVHVPFCARRCSYCDFAISVRRDTPSDAFRDAILSEWRGYRDAAWWSDVGPIGTIYFGGGTPSRLDPATIGSLVTGFRADRVVAADAEVTLETNPDDVTAERAAGWVAAGVTRVSLGVQSFEPAVLTWMHRTHTSEQPVEAIGMLRAAGIGNVSVDLIYAVPADLQRNWATDLDRALSLDPDHVSLYGLTVEGGTPLGKWVDRGDAVPAEDIAAEAEYLAAHDALGRAGLIHYEVSNAARPGFESRHNRAYWARRTYLGLGPSSHSAHGDRRWWNIRDWEEYRRAITDGAPIVAGEERLTAEQIALEQRYLGLRTLTGVPKESVSPEQATRWIGAGWARLERENLVLTAEGWLRLDAIAAEG